MFHKLAACLAAFLFASVALAASETFVGNFAEPRDGGNLDTTYSTFDGTTVMIVPRAHPSEAVSGSTRWRNLHFAIRGVQGKAPVFRLPMTSPGSGKTILSGDAVSFQNIKLVWSYEPNTVKWNAFDTHTRNGSTCSTWKVEAQNSAAFEHDIVYVSINERYPVADFYEWLEADVLTHALVKPTPSEASPGTFVIGYQSGAPASAACSRAIPDMPLFSFIIRDADATPTELIVLVSGQHPYEGQNKVALQAAIDWILKSTSAEAKAYRARYVTLVYPFVNPTGELAGLWRGTAYQPSKDTNRNWHTSETVPSRNRGIDTVIVHKNAMKKDIATLGLGEPFAVLDYHQNFGDYPGQPDYLLHSSASTSSTAPVSRQVASTELAAYFARLTARTTMASKPSDPSGIETLRGYMISRGAKLPLTFERSVYNTIASEWEFGLASVMALVDPATVPAQAVPAPIPPTDTPDPAVDPEPAPVDGGTVGGGTSEPPTETPPTPSAPEEVWGALLISDDFTGGVNLSGRTPDGIAPAGARWLIHTGVITIDPNGNATTKISSRATIDAGAADVDVTSKFRLGANNTGLVLRASDSQNYLRFVLTSTGWSLQRTAGGATSNLLSGKAAFSYAADCVLSATLRGSSVVLSIDGITVGAVEVTFNQTATRFGLVSSNAGVRLWDTFIVRGDVDPAPAEGGTVGGGTGEPAVEVPPPPAPPAPNVAEPVPPVPAETRGAVLVSDDFTGGVNLSGRTPDGIAPAGARWLMHSGVITVDGNGNATTKISSRATIDAGAADVDVASKFQLGANNTGLILRASDSQNYLRFVLTSTGWSLQRTSAGATSNLLSGKATFSYAADYVLSATLRGSSVVLSIDGVTVGAVEVIFNQTATRFGLLSSNAGVRIWDTFIVRRGL